MKPSIWSLRAMRRHLTYSEAMPVECEDLRRAFRSFWIDTIAFGSATFFVSWAAFCRGVVDFSALTSLLAAICVDFILELLLDVLLRLLWPVAAQMNGKIESSMPSPMTSFNFSFSTTFNPPVEWLFFGLPWRCRPSLLTGLSVGCEHEHIGT